MDNIDEITDELEEEQTVFDDSTKNDIESRLQSLGFEIPKDNSLLSEVIARFFFAIGIHEDLPKNVQALVNRVGIDTNFVEGTSLQERVDRVLGACVQYYVEKIESSIDLLKSRSSNNYFIENNSEWRDQALAQIKASAASEEALSFSVQALELLRTYCDNGLEVDYDAVLCDIMQSDPENAVKLRQNIQRYRQMLESTANIYISCMNHASKEQERASNILNSTTVILNRELTELNKMNDLYNKGQLSFIRQIYEMDNNYYFKCPKCGKMHEVKSLMIMYVVGDTNASEPFLVPVLCTCECGYNAIISYYDLVAVLLNFVNSGLQETINNMWKNIIKNSQSAGICRYKIAITKVKSFLPESMFVSTDEFLISNNMEKTDKVTEKETHFNNVNEYEEALDLFYSSVQHLPKDSKMIYPGLYRIYEGVSVVQNIVQPTEDNFDPEYDNKVKLYHNLTESANKDTLSYSILAIHVAKTLSKEYKTLKNRAILSLLYSLQSNKLMNVISGIEKYSQLYADLQTLKTCASYNKSNIPVEVSSELINLYATYGTPLEHDEPEEVLRAIAMSSVDILIMSIEKEISEIKNNVQWVKNTLYAMKDVVIYTKILNISTSRLDSLSLLLADEEFSKYCNEIADKMIITNYVERTLSKSVVNKLESVEDAKTLYSLCYKQLKAHVGDYPSKNYGSTCGKHIDIFYESYFPLLRDTSLLGCSIIGDVWDALKEFNLFRATKLVAESDISLAQFDEGVPNSVGTQVRNAINSIKHFYEVHLSNYTESRFYYTLAGFKGDTEDVPEGASYDFDYTRILKRLPNETFNEYKLRAKSAESENKEYVSSDVYFKKILRDLYVMSLAGTILRTEIKSFVKTSYAVSLYNFISNELLVNSACDALNISPRAYREYLTEVHDVDLYFKDGENFTALEKYTVNQELTLALSLISEKYNAVLFVSQRDNIYLSCVIEDLVEEFTSILNEMEERKIPLGAIPNKEGKNNYATDVPIIDYSAQELSDDLKGFLGV